MKLLDQLCRIAAPSGSEEPMKDFLLRHIGKEKKRWAREPQVLHGPDFQDCIILSFGSPRTAAFAHVDSVGFTVRYQNQLLPIGSPDAESGTVLTGHDSLGPIEGILQYDAENHAFCQFPRTIERGTTLTYKVHFRQEDDFITAPYLDNRLGVYNLLKLAETLEDGVLVFSTWEEHGGGAVPFLTRYIYERWKIRNALVSDITWVTDGVHHGKGVAISMRDRNIPRQAYVRRIIDIAQKHRVPFQLEVEGVGSSDGREIQLSPYPIDWCFVGAPEQHAHSPNETVHTADIESMLALYTHLMREL